MGTTRVGYVGVLEGVWVVVWCGGRGGRGYSFILCVFLVIIDECGRW